jgi:hypothetical protein
MSMPRGFDLFHAWLGMPPGSRPTNHYELLGLKLFQSEPPIIADAADEQMANAKRHVVGAHAAVAHQLLEELAAARTALLSPLTKRRYDAKLRQELATPEARLAVAERPQRGTPPPRSARTGTEPPVQAIPTVHQLAAAQPAGNGVPVAAVQMADVPRPAAPADAPPAAAVTQLRRRVPNTDPKEVAILPPAPPRASLIRCYVCNRTVADNAPSCPHCGAIQTAEGRTKGRQTQDTIVGLIYLFCIVAAVPAVVFGVICGGCVDTLLSPSSHRGEWRSSSPLGGDRSLPSGWDREQLERDAYRAVTEPGKTVFIPLDGSQPRVVDDPDAP